MDQQAWEDFNKDRAITMAQERELAERTRVHHAPGWAPPAPKNPLNGVGFGLLLMSPFLFWLYLALGLSLWVAMGVPILLAIVFKIQLGILIVLGIALFVAAWIYGLKLERRLSQIKAYRVVRGTVRMVLPVAMVVMMGASSQVSGPAMAFAILAIVPFYLLCRLFDRLYFPVWSEVIRKNEMAKQGIADTRPLSKRVFYALVWVIPFIAIVQVLVLIIASLFAGGRGETMELIDPIRNYLGPGAILLWLILSVMGKLPGTRKHRKSFVDHEAQLEMRN